MTLFKMICSLPIMLLGGIALAQAPSSQIDAHIAAAKAAEGR